MFWCVNCESIIKDNENKCNKCNSSSLVNIYNGKITIGEMLILKNISKDISFLEAMVSLKETDPIEYQLKMSQFKSQTGQQESGNIPKCPTCGSTSLSKITATSKAVSVGLFGIFSQKVKKTWHCENCKYEW